MAVISCKSLCFFLLIAIVGSLITDAREVKESVFFGKIVPKRNDFDSDLSASRDIEKANKFGLDPNQSLKNDDLANIYSNKIDQEEADEENDDIPDEKLKGNGFETNNFDEESQQNGNKNGYKAYPYGIGETHYLDEDRFNGEDDHDDQKQTNENPYYQYEGGVKHLSFNNKNKNNNRGYNTRNPWNNERAVRKQGMSDTRYLDNGKYYYNVDKDLTSYGNNNNRYNSYQTSQSSNNYNDNYFSGNRFGSSDEFENNDDKF